MHEQPEYTKSWPNDHKEFLQQERKTVLNGNEALQMKQAISIC